METAVKDFCATKKESVNKNIQNNNEAAHWGTT